MAKKVCIINGHPGTDRFSGALAESYAAGVSRRGGQATMLTLSEMDFDPILHEGYAVIQEMEPDLVKAQSAIMDSDHIVFVYPTWWGGPPALLKGFIERTFLPGTMFRYHGDDSLRWDKLMKRPSVRCITTMDSPGIIYLLFAGAPGDRMMKRSVMRFCGAGSVKFTRFTMLKLRDAARREAWIARAGAIGEKDAD